MRILLVGGGGREHAMARALTSAGDVDLLCAPGNPGTAQGGRNIDVAAGDVDGIVRAARREAVDLVVVGPEAPLVAGLADALAAAAVPCCGPSGAAARLEGSKAFTREVATAAGVPSPHYEIVRDVAALERAIEAWDGLPVVKADGLAAGKGVFLPESTAGCISAGRALLDGKLGDAGRTVVLEERLQGTEASLFYACAGEVVVALPHARDHKRLLDGDQGPNTGGMGAVSPNPLIDAATEKHVRRAIIRPTLQTLAARGTPFAGFLFAGLMLTDDGPKLLEYNVRLGDPEAQAILPRLHPGEFARLCRATAAGRLQDFELDIDPCAVCAVVLAAAGYPESPHKGDPIHIDAGLAGPDRWLIHAGTARHDRGLVTQGGRVAAVVARGTSAATARALAYDGVGRVHFNAMQVRRDIGAPRSNPQGGSL